MTLTCDQDSILEHLNAFLQERYHVDKDMLTALNQYTKEVLLIKSLIILDKDLLGVSL